VRGFSSPGVYNSRVLELSDGHITNESSLGQGYIGHDFDADLSDVERIEVVRGPGSVLYGGNAMLGTINIVTRKASNQPGLVLVAALSTEWGSFHTPAGKAVYFTLAFAPDPPRGGDRAAAGGQTRGCEPCTPSGSPSPLAAHLGKDTNQ